MSRPMWSRHVRVLRDIHSRGKGVIMIQIPIPYDDIVRFCERNHIHRLALFGSVLRDDFRPDSDIDVLVEFEPGVIIGWRIVQIEEDLSTLLSQQVDLNTAQDLSPHFRQKVLNAAQVIYERA
jgi:uncharacterized protein